MGRNDITGDNIVTDVPSEKFKSGWDAIWGETTPQEVQEILDQPSIPVPRDMSKEELQNFINMSSKFNILNKLGITIM